MNLLKVNPKVFALILFYLAINALIYFNFTKQKETALNQFRNEQKNKVTEIASDIDFKVSQVYQTLRTMSLLPGTKTLDRYGKNFSRDSKETVQQLYNNAYSNLKLSEVYFLPESLAAHKIDPVTHEKEAPILTFDEFIVADKKTEDGPQEKIELAEEEIYEYEVMEEQLKFLSNKYPSNKNFSDLNIPWVSSAPVITCDNSEMRKEDVTNQNNEPRLGIIFTVPVYDSVGKFKGGVAAIIRKNVFKELLPRQGIALVNQTKKTEISKRVSPEFASSRPHFYKGESNPNLFFSYIYKFTNPLLADYQVWATAADSEFYETIAYKNAWQTYLILLIASTLILSLLYYQTNRSQNLLNAMIQAKNQLDVEAHSLQNDSMLMSKSSTEVGDNTQAQASATGEIAASVTEIQSMLQKSLDITLNLNELMNKNNDIVNKHQTDNNEQKQAIESVQTSQNEIINKVLANSQGMYEIMRFIAEIASKTKVIDEIVFQSKILSFNASVEAARAGEMGRGFSVVAEEMGQLARLSGQAARDINTLISEGQKNIQALVAKTEGEIVSTVEDAQGRVIQVIRKSETIDESLVELFQSSQNSLLKSEEIRSACQEQVHAIEQISIALNQLNDGNNYNTEAAKRVAAVAENLGGEADRVINLAQQMSQIILNEKNQKVA